MTKTEAIQKAIETLDATKVTQFVLRRGDKYDVFPADKPSPQGWKTAEMISRGNVQNYRTTTARIDAKVETAVDALASAVDAAEAKTGVKLIDITPRGCETVEGTRRVVQVQKEWDDVTHELANRLAQEIDDIFDRSTNKISAAELYSEFQTLIGIRETKQEAFFRAVAGVPDREPK